MTAEEKVWRRQFDDLCDAVERHTTGIDGHRYVDDSCPADLTATYQAFVQVGYAKGWMA